MRFYEVYVADSRYRSDKPLIYSYDGELSTGNVVTVPLRDRAVTAFVSNQTEKPGFVIKPIKSLLSEHQIPEHCLELAHWLKDYYACTLGEALRQFAPSRPVIRAATEVSEMPTPKYQLNLTLPLNDDQKQAIKKISQSSSTTILLHGDTGTGKTRVYLELAKKTLGAGQSVIILTPEIALTSQLALAISEQLHQPLYIFHSQLSIAERRKIWKSILEARGPIIVIGPRSALFSPIANLGLVVLDEAHEPAYKQEQSPRYHAVRVASQLGSITGAKVVLGTATPTVTDFYLAKSRGAIARMTKPALGTQRLAVSSKIVDLKDRQNFTASPFLSKQLIDAIRTTLSAKKQVMIYLNRRGTARLILCTNCAWQLLCPNCDIPLVYHGDSHQGRCHICGFKQTPPANCPKCQNPDIVYRSIGTKALVEAATRLFPQHRVQRFDSDNLVSERVNELFEAIQKGEVDILIGTQLLAKGLDLPKLSLVGVISAETSLSLPDYSSEERAFQLLYQVIGRVGRGHTQGNAVIQTYEPQSLIIKSALSRDWPKFYDYILKQRRDFRFPPFAYLLKVTGRRLSAKAAEQATTNLKSRLQGATLRKGLKVEIVGPAPAFYARRGHYYYWQIVAKSKDRGALVELAKHVPDGWSVDLDPTNLL